jgi:hypothetical protein
VKQDRAGRGAVGDSAAAGHGARYRSTLGAAGAAGSISAVRHVRLLAGSAACRASRRGPRDDHEVLAIALDTGELVCRHQRSFAKHRTITAVEHAHRTAPRAPPGPSRSRGASA